MLNDRKIFPLLIAVLMVLVVLLLSNKVQYLRWSRLRCVYLLLLQNLLQFFTTTLTNISEPASKHLKLLTAAEFIVLQWNRDFVFGFLHPCFCVKNKCLCFQGQVLKQKKWSNRSWLLQIDCIIKFIEWRNIISLVLKLLIMNIFVLFVLPNYYFSTHRKGIAVLWALVYSIVVGLSLFLYEN